ncbi:MAG: 4-phosphopantoate--beta-alanine ligase [Methanobacteriaceae archaeon]|nr:4-phosphopantoate--beta-alanine ligase [Methanobacteriaceae archaeon]
MQDIPQNHPRYHSLILRKKISEAHKNGVLAESGLIAHGRGEAFDYLLGEKTIPPAKKAIEAAATQLLLAKHPVISVNGNTTALSAREVVQLSSEIEAPLEINLFYRTPDRVDKIEKILKNNGAKKVLGSINQKYLPLNGLEGPRSLASMEGIYQADVVLVPLEDGDRVQALQDNGKTVITVELNPISRTAKTSSITIVDNLIRALPLLIKQVQKLKVQERSRLVEIVEKFDNQENLKKSLEFILADFKDSVRS